MSKDVLDYLQKIKDAPEGKRGELWRCGMFYEDVGDALRNANLNELRDKFKDALAKNIRLDGKKYGNDNVKSAAELLVILIDELAGNDSATKQLSIEENLTAFSLENQHTVISGNRTDFELKGDELKFTAAALEKLAIDILAQIETALETAAQDEKEKKSDTAPVTTTDTARQNFENLPMLMHYDARFIPCGNGDNPKRPKISMWNTPERQGFFYKWREKSFWDEPIHWQYKDRKTGEIKQGTPKPFEPDCLLSFDISGHGNSLDYLFVDFDHVLDDDGNFIDSNAEQIYNDLLKISPNIYVEYSLSRTGLHAFLFPNAKKFEDAAGKHVYKLRGNAKIEFFYKTRGTAALVTGEKFRDCGNDLPESTESNPAVDEFFSSILKKIEEQAGKKAKPSTSFTNFTASDNNPDRDLALIRACLATTAAADIRDYYQWLKFMSGCKAAGLSWEEFDSWASYDDEHYNQDQNFDSWNGLAANYQYVGNAVNVAKNCGRFDAQIFDAQYRIEHPEYYKPVAQSKKIEKEKKVESVVTASAPETTEPADNSGDDGLTQKQRDKVFNQIQGDSDLANARRFIAVEGGKIRYIEESDRWLTYEQNRGLWLASAKGRNTTVLPLVVDTADKLAAAAESKNDVKIAIPFSNARKIPPMLMYVKGLPEVRITSADLDRDTNLLNVQNGVVDLQTGKLYSHAPDKFMTKCAPVIYRRGYRNAEVDDFLNDIQPDAEDLLALLVYLGYCATGEKGAEKFLVMQGSGGNGKGTLTKPVLKMFGGYGTTLRPAALLKGKSSDPNAATTALNVLIGKRYAIVDEFSQGDRLDVATVKRITGGDTLSFRALFEEEVPVDLSVKLLLSSNYQIEFADVNDGGLLRRFMYLPFSQNFSNRADTTLKERLMSRDCFSGLLTRIVEGSVWYYSHGQKLYESPTMTKARASYLDDQDWIGNFISEYCFFDEQGAIRKKEFIEKLRATNERMARRYSDNVLHEMIQRIEGITFEPRHYYTDEPRGRQRKASYVGICWNDGD